MWDMILTAFALLLVIEGIMPFLSPNSYRKMMIHILTCNNKILRSIGLIAMLIGALLMYLIHSGILSGYI